MSGLDASANNFAFDSDNDYERPKDDFTFYLEAFKIEEKKMIGHQKFEEITTKYWNMLKVTTEQDPNKNTISKDQYIQELQEEWVLDSKGQADLTFNLLTKVLFRVAHEWATNIDMDEYIDLLNRIYDRIVRYELVGLSYTESIFQTIKVSFPTLEKKVQDNGGKVEQQKTQNDDWLECRSDESNKSDFDYKYEEDPENMVVKKYKKQKGNSAQGGGIGGTNINQVIKEPFVYQEEVINNYNESREGFYLKTILLDLPQIIPFGYPTLELLKQIKDQIYTGLESAKSQAKANFQYLNKEQKEGVKNFTGLVDSGLVEENGQQVEVAVYTSFGYINIFKTSLPDSIYNSIRQQLRDGSIMSLKLYSMYPKPGQRSKSRSGISNNEPIVEANKFLYNPALERRINFKLFEDQYGSMKYQNVNYMLEDSQNEFYRMDINKIQTKDKLVLKENDEIKKEEEFNHVETSYKKLRQIMLFKKFETIYQDRASADNKEQKRLKKLIEKEDKRRNHTHKQGSIAQKGLSETYEDKSFIKMMKGPFYQLDSKEGMKEDDFVICGEQDLIEAARTQAMRILIIGKPRSGKTTTALTLSQKLDLVHINVENWINDLLARIKAYEPPELEEGQEEPKWLTDLEGNVSQSLLQGGGPSDDQVVEILKLQIRSPQAVLKGFILDLSYYQRDQTWASTIRQKQVLGEPDEIGRLPEFTHILELWCEDEDVRLRSENMRANPEDNKVYSRWEREELKKPKIVNEDEDPVEEENEVKPLDERALVQRSQDTEDRIKEELHYYNTLERPAMEELLINFYENQYIKIDSSGLTPEELAECFTSRLKPDDDLPLRPLAIQIEGGSDFKSLLTEGIEENQLPRKWSLWRQTDPVALADGKVIQGLPDYAAHYSGNVFVFATEENMKAFLIQPKSYLQNRPTMPSIFRILMLGSKGVGKHTQAQLLSEIYGWTIIDYKELVRNKLEELQKFEIHIPNNPQLGGRIGLSEQELNDIAEGKSLPAWKFIPWIYDFLGYKLEKRKPPPPEEKQEDELQEEEPPQLTEQEMKKKLIEEKKKREEEDRKRKEEEELQRFKEDRRRRRQEAIDNGQNPHDLGIEDSEEEPIIIEDLSIDQLVLKSDEESGKQPFVGGFILINYPETEEQINKLKGHGFEFDRIIFLNDTNEEEPGAEIKQRMKGVELYDWDWEQENSQKILALVKEHLNEEIVREISCNGTREDVFIRIRNEIDPFFIKIDNPDDVRVSADLGEEDKKLPKGDFGDFCPVTYVKDNWLVRGNPEQEVTIHGKTYWLSGEKEAEPFKFNPKAYLLPQFNSQPLPLNIPPPRLMILGHRGAGTTIQQTMLADRFKLDIFNLKEEFVKKLKEEKEKRKRRRLLDRGFKPLPPSDEDGAEPQPDPEIEDDPEDFDKEGHEREVMKMIYDNSKGYIIDGNWRDVANLPDVPVAQTLQDLLFESRRVPEVVIVLRCKESATFDRIINRVQIRAEFDRLMEVRENERKRLREEERAAYYQEITAVPEDQQEEEGKTPEEIQELMTVWDENRDQTEKDQDENDPDMPNYDAMEEVEREKLREQRAADDTLFEEFVQALRDKQVVVIDEIKADLSAEFINVKLLDRIKENMEYRKDIIERQLTQVLTESEVKQFEKSYIYSHSKFGLNSPLALSTPLKTKKNAVLYRERLYFLANQDQQQKFLKEPSKYSLSQETIPLELNIKPRILVLGLPKSGKSTLCQRLVEKAGVVHLRISQIIDYFIGKDCYQGEQLRKQMKKEGRPIEDDQLVNLLIKRVQFKDCQTRGWVLEDFPKTRNQALFLAKRGFVPSNVFLLRQDGKQTFKRTDELSMKEFGHNKIIVGSRIKHFEANNPHVISFYQKLYNNVFELDARKSKWFLEDRAVNEIQKNLEARQNFARDYFLRERNESRPCKVKSLHMDRCLLKQSLSEFNYYCPVTWKNEKLLVKCSANKEDCVLYKNVFYYFRGQKERDLFINNPARFIVNVILPKTSDLPIRATHHKAAEVVLHEKQLNFHCSVTLMDEERVKKGDQILLVVFRDDKYIFENEFKLQRFLQNPFKYSKAVLPVKLPPPEDKISLFNLQKMEDSIAFMEQSLGQVVTRGLREISDNRLKHPGMSVKETMLKLFALFLKMENPGNTPHLKKKYHAKVKLFIQRCELPEELYDLAVDKGKITLNQSQIVRIEKKKPKGEWPEFKENYYNNKGAEYDQNAKTIELEKQDNFMSYLR